MFLGRVNSYVKIVKCLTYVLQKLIEQLCRTKHVQVMTTS